MTDQTNDQPKFAVSHDCGMVVVACRLPGTIWSYEFPAFVFDRGEEKPEQRKDRESRVPGVAMIPTIKQGLVWAPNLLAEIEAAFYPAERGGEEDIQADFVLRGVNAQQRLSYKKPFETEEGLVTPDPTQYTVVTFTFVPRETAGDKVATAEQRDYAEKFFKRVWTHAGVYARHFLADGADSSLLIHFAAEAPGIKEHNFVSYLGYGLQEQVNPKRYAGKKLVSKPDETDETRHEDFYNQVLGKRA